MYLVLQSNDGGKTFQTMAGGVSAKPYGEAEKEAKALLAAYPNRTFVVFKRHEMHRVETVARVKKFDD